MSAVSLSTERLEQIYADGSVASAAECEEMALRLNQTTQGHTVNGIESWHIHHDVSLEVYEGLRAENQRLRAVLASLLSKLPECHVCKKPGTYLSHYHFEWFYACDEHYEGDKDATPEAHEDDERAYAPALRAAQAAALKPVLHTEEEK